MARLVSIPPPSILMRSHLFYQWTRIAAFHTRLARWAREEMVAARDSGGESPGSLSSELEASLVAVCAVSFAIDALYGAVKDLGDPTAHKGHETSRHGRIHQTYHPVDRHVELPAPGAMERALERSTARYRGGCGLAVGSRRGGIGCGPVHDREPRLAEPPGVP